MIWENKIVTEISKLTEFYKAEEYHQNYYNQNSNQSYCSLVINPKLKKFNQGKDQKFWFENGVLKMLKETWQHPLIEGYEKLLAKERELK